MGIFNYKRHEKKTVSFVKLWDEIIATNLNKNDSNFGELRRAPFYMDLQGFYSGTDNVTYVYSIDGYPSEIEVSYRTTLRKECKAGVRMSFISTFEKHQILWNSPQMRSKLKTWQVLEMDETNVNEYNLHSNLLLLDSQTWRSYSLTYLSTAEIRRKRKLFRFRSLLFVSGVRGDDFNDTIKDLTATCTTLGITLTRVMLNIEDYLRSFSPFNLTTDNAVLKEVGSIVATDELLARFSTYSQGIIGKMGTYWGTDIYSYFPCLKPVKRTTETAENWLITAETGWGKSLFIKCLILQLLASKYYNGTIMDIEGFEYIFIAHFVANYDEVFIINMAEGTGAYFDPVAITLTGDSKLDEDMYALSTSFTISFFKTLIGKISASSNWVDWVDIVINDAISLTYSKAGVEDDMSTWYNGEDLTVFDVYDTFKSLLNNLDINRAVNNALKHDEYNKKMEYDSILPENINLKDLLQNNDGYQKAVEFILAKLSRYFEVGGTRSSLLKTRVTVKNIKDAKLVICSFGMAGKSPDAVDPVQMSLMQLCAANISHLRSIFSKLAGKFNFKLWEEFQRWGNFPDSEKTISTALTGGRKLGDINIIITNEVGKLLKDDKFGIFANITSFAIGSVNDANVREDLCTRLTIERMLPELDKLVSDSANLKAYSDGDSVANNPYINSFLIGLDKTVYTLSRMYLPDDLVSSKIFRTGIDLADAESDNDNIKVI